MLQFPEEYFEDEVRDGFYVPSMIKRAWATELDVLDEVDRICRKYNITYYAEWGTLLGAIRHAGYVPWDDDLDIGMRREDYVKFCKVAPGEFVEGYQIINFRTNKDFHHFLARVVCKNRICFEDEHLRRYHGFPYLAGLDIYVHDNVSKDKKAQEKCEKTAEYIVAVADAIEAGQMSAEDEQAAVTRINMICGTDIRVQQDKCQERIELYSVAENVFATFKDEECEEMTQMMPYSLYGNHMRIPVKYYERVVRVPFENTTIPVPIGFDAMLKSRYGDYMKLVRNAGGHDYPFYESQKKQLEVLMDFKLPEYTYDEKKAVRAADSDELAGYRKILKNCLDNIDKQIEEIGHMQDVEVIREELVDIQQIVIDMGGLIEKVKGEGTESVRSLEKFCDVIYEIYQENNADIESEFGNVRRMLENDIFAKKEELFLVSKASEWKYIENVWKKHKEERDTEIVVAVVPYYYKEYDGSIKKEVNELDKFATDIGAVDSAQYDMELHHPDIIYIQNPFDNENRAIGIDRKYYSDRLKCCTDKLIYIQSFELEEFNEFNEREYKNMASFCTVPGVINADVAYVQSYNIRNMYIKKLTEFAGKETESIWDDKIHAKPEWMMNKEHCIANGNGKKKILFYTSISGLMQNSEIAAGKIKNVLDIFKQYSGQIEIVWCVQSLVDTVMEDIDKKLYEQIIAIRNQYNIEQIGHVCSDRDKDMLSSCDAYYGDTSSIVQDYRNARKPVMIMDYEI